MLAAIPFAVYFAWRWRMQRGGAEARATPWAWLVGVAALLVAASFMLLPLVTPSHVGQTYVPAQALPDGSVRPGRFE